MILKPFDSTETTTFEYTAADDRNVIKSLFSDGVMAMDCDSSNYTSKKDVIGKSFLVSTTGSNIVINNGCAMISGLHIYEPEETNLEVPTNYGNNPQNYNVIIAADLSAEEVKIEVVHNSELPSKYLLLATFEVQPGTNIATNIIDQRQAISTIAYCESTSVINSLTESGTWIPEIYVVQGGTVKQGSNDIVTGKYYKIGKLLFVQAVLNCKLIVSATTGSNGVVIGIKGLPYTVHHCAITIGKSIAFFKNPPTTAIASGGAIRFYTDSDHAYVDTYRGQTMQELYISGVCYINT